MHETCEKEVSPKLIKCIVPLDFQGFDFYHHRANIISTIMSRGAPLALSSQFVTQHDEVTC